MRTFLDSGVLIAGFNGTHAVHLPCYEILNDPQRVFIASPYLEMELIPQPTYNRRLEEVEFMEAYLAQSECAASTDELLKLALVMGKQYGLDAVDALHAATACLAGCAELITTEKVSKPIHRVKEVIVRPVV